MSSMEALYPNKNTKRPSLSKIMVCLSAAALLSACVHTTPNPVPVSQPGDDKMSCATIENEMMDMQAQRADSDARGNRQVAKNVGLGVAGAFLLVPLFFMDTSDAHSVEAKAAQARYKRLMALYQDKGCVPPETANGASSTASSAQAKE